MSVGDSSSGSTYSRCQRLLGNSLRPLPLLSGPWTQLEGLGPKWEVDDHGLEFQNVRIFYQATSIFRPSCLDVDLRIKLRHNLLKYLAYFKIYFIPSTICCDKMIKLSLCYQRYNVCSVYTNFP